MPQQQRHGKNQQRQQQAVGDQANQGNKAVKKEEPGVHLPF